MSTPNFDLSSAHRWFAIEFNNRAWDLVEAATRSVEETAEMIAAAHAAALHWRAVGQPINQLRAECLLATAYAAAGFGQPAVNHAERCLRLSEQIGDEQTAFDRATVQGCAANAFEKNGDAERAQTHRENLADIQVTLADAGEQALLSKLYGTP
jgi:hypothetical protein